jgi:hypothetical protein
MANGECVQVPRGQAVRVLAYDALPKRNIIKSALSPPRVELLGNPASGHWYIDFATIGGPQRLIKDLEDMEKQFRAGNEASARRSGLMVAAQGYLADAGITDYKFLAPLGPDDEELAWEYSDGSRGTLLIPQPGKATVASLLAKTMERDTAYCKGQYSSGYMPARYYLGSEIRKAYTACSDGVRSFATYYSVVASPTGRIMRFGSGGTFAQTNASPEAVPRAERLENAAVKTMTAVQSKEKR